ncbi:MAG: hypothetical protein WCP31_00025 [Chloroflexales bacterium]
MITIIADRHAASRPPAEALVALTLADYVPVRQQIRAALDQGHALIVYATNSVLLGWLSDLQRYPERHVAWREVEPSAIFMRLFGCPPTAPFTSQGLAALNLEDLPLPPRGSDVQPLPWLLGQRLDPLWQYDTPPPHHAALLAAWASEQTAPLERALVPLVQGQLEHWAKTAQVYQGLRALSLAEDGAMLVVRWALQHYDASWRTLQPWGALPVLTSAPPSQAVVAALRPQQATLQTYWHQQITATPPTAETLAAALSQMSGLSDAEVAALETMLQRCPAALDARLLTACQRRFAQLPTAATLLRTLAEQVAPPVPALPEAAWTTEQWLGWATQAYMPYYAWVIRSGQGRAHQQACALRYSDWLYQHYPAWLNETRSPLLLSQYQDLTALLEPVRDVQLKNLGARASRPPHNHEGETPSLHPESVVVIWLIIDGLTWWQGALMGEACARHGLHVQAQRPGIAVLPSITSIAKRALVTGQPTIDLTEPSIAEAARVKLARSNVPAYVGYSLPDAVATLRTDATVRVCVVLCNTLDSLAHQTTTFTDSAGFRGHLEDLAHGLHQGLQVCVAQGRRLHVLIGSDHGSTLLPTDALSLALPQQVQELDEGAEPEFAATVAQRPGTRAAVTERAQLPSLDPTCWYALERERFQLDRHYVVPRGYTYIKRRPVGWTHGGLTPEETLVPLMHLAAERLAVRAIELAVRGTLRAGQADSVTVSLRNLNPFPVQGLTLLVAGGPDEVLLTSLGALAEQEVVLQFPAVMTRGATLSVSYTVHYAAFGTHQCDEGQLSLPLRRLQTEDSTFDDMFE